MALFVSTFINKVDKKGRVSVPASFRATLVGQPVQGIVLFPSFTAPAAEGCAPEFLEELAANTTAAFNMFSEEQDDIATLVFSSSHQLSWDTEGRVLLPEAILACANIGEAAAFVGKGRTFQIWEPEAYKAREAEVRARALAKRPQVPPRREGGQ